jgi:hypothetical protein
MAVEKTELCGIIRGSLGGALNIFRMSAVGP